MTTTNSDWIPPALSLQFTGAGGATERVTTIYCPGLGQQSAGDAFADLNVAERGALVAMCHEIIDGLDVGPTSLGADHWLRQYRAAMRDLLLAETKLSESVPAYYGTVTYDDGSRTEPEWWVKAADGDWISLDSDIRTSRDIQLQHFSCWPSDGPPHAAGVRP